MLTLHFLTKHIFRPPIWAKTCRYLKGPRFFWDVGCGPFERASKIIRITTLDDTFGDLEPEISWSKGGPGVSSGGPPLEPIWRPMVTWRRVLRTTFLNVPDGCSGTWQYCLTYALVRHLSIQMLEVAQTIAFVVPENARRSKYLFYRANKVAPTHDHPTPFSHRV